MEQPPRRYSDEWWQALAERRLGKVRSFRLHDATTDLWRDATVLVADSIGPLLIRISEDGTIR